LTVFERRILGKLIDTPDLMSNVGKDEETSLYSYK